ncbi:MAG TPA: M15 family metallopeptidase [Acidimicrobiia bacterium]
MDAERLAHSYTPDCPVGPDDVVFISLRHWGLDGAVHTGAIVVARAEGENVVAIFRRLFEIRYPIESVVPIGDLPEGVEDDDPAYNNTSGLHCRRAMGSTRWSEHSRGLAIDINPLQNPFVTPNILWPQDSDKYLDRTLEEPGMIEADDEVVRAFEGYGWLWGGYWSSIKDYQHFSTTGR